MSLRTRGGIVVRHKARQQDGWKIACIVLFAVLVVSMIGFFHRGSLIDRQANIISEQQELLERFRDTQDRTLTVARKAIVELSEAKGVPVPPNFMEAWK